MGSYERKTKLFVAVGSFFAAVLLAFTSVLISANHDVASGVLMMCAQFLTLTATIFILSGANTIPTVCSPMRAL